MYEDDPQELVFDVLGGAVFGEHPLGRPIIGSRATVVAADADGLRGSMRALRARRPGRGGGRLGRPRRARRARRARAVGRRARRRAPAFRRRRCAASRARRFIARSTEQYHLTLGGHGVARDDERRFALRVLDMILGGTSSSRLFQAVRERRGLAYSIFSWSSQHVGTGQVGIYLGTRPDDVKKAVKVVGEELERLVADGVTADEVRRARDHVRARLALDLELTESRMTRIGAATLAGLPLLTIDQLIERIGDVSADDVDALARELFDPAGPALRGSARTRMSSSAACSRDAGPRAGGLSSAPIRVAVAGAAGRMGQAVCEAVEGVPDMVLSGRADPALGTSLADVLPRGRLVVDFTQPDAALDNALQSVRAGVHVVIGTTGFDLQPLRAERGANVFVAPDFAIGAVLMMRFAAEAAQHFPGAEIIELHHDRKLDTPSGTAARTRRRWSRIWTAACRSTRSACRGSSHTRRSSSEVSGRR